ncbi:stomatin-like protein [uncultured Desulfovibrio sp.]|uniref:SPFH domain-containing protein n=1 Tax=uncultured Desulfovibrio sp. TaxID=167968 RepID=UPI00262B3542|nr:stomatin-like protein [uncultured Desulfovibrio sp.]
MVDDYSSVMSWAVSGAILLLVIIFLSRCVAIVPTQSAYIVERLGKFRGVLHAGFHVLIPFFDRVAYRRSLKEQVLDVPEQTCITRDNVSVSIDGVLFLQVLSPEKSAYGISDYEWGAIQLAQTALRSAIGKLEMDKTFEERARINQEVVEALDDATAAWGVKVLRYEIRDITPPASVMEAMEKQMRAEREKRAVIAQSEGNMQSQINLAEGAKAAAIAESEGLKQAMINKAEGEAAQIRTVAQATADGLDAVAMRLDAQGGVAAAQLRLAEAYVEKFGELAKKGTTTIIPANVGDVAGMVATLTQILRPGEGLSKPSGPGTGAPQA